MTEVVVRSVWYGHKEGIAQEIAEHLESGYRLDRIFPCGQFNVDIMMIFVKD